MKGVFPDTMSMTVEKSIHVKARYKIAVFHNLPSKGGGMRSQYEFMKLLKRKGHLLDLFQLQFNWPREDFWNARPFVNQVYSFDLQESYISQVHLPFISGYLQHYWQLKMVDSIDEVSKTVADRINQGGYDLAFVGICEHTHSPCVLKYLKIPSVYYCHEPKRIFYEPFYEFLLEQRDISIRRRIRKLWYAPMDNYARLKLKRIDYENLWSSDVVLTNSNAAKAAIYHAYGVHARVNYLGADIEEFVPLGLPKENFVLSVGTLHPVKQHDFVIQSASLIEKGIRPSVTVVAAKPNQNEQKFLMDLATELGVQVQILIGVSDRELVDLYNRSSLLACAAVMEPFGYTPLEAMACGTPVVAVAEGGFAETIIDGKTGFLTERKPAEFAQAMTTLLKHEDLREDLGSVAREHVCKNWTQESSVENLLNNFQDALKDFSAARNGEG